MTVCGSAICQAQSGSIQLPARVLLERQALERIVAEQQTVMVSLSVGDPQAARIALIMALGVEQSLRDLAHVGSSRPLLATLALQQTAALTRLAVLARDQPTRRAHQNWTTWALYLANTIQQGLFRLLLDINEYSSRSPARH